MSFAIRVSEPKLDKSGTFTVRAVKVGNRLLGTIETPKMKPGERPQATFWASPEVVSLSDHGQHLAVNRAYIANLRTYAVKTLGLRCPDGSRYTIGLDMIQETSARSPAGKYIGIATICWNVELPPEEERVANLMSKMRVAGGRRGQSVVSAVK